MALLDDDLDDQHKTDESNTIVDYTSPEYISAIFTDMGIFTPAAVSDQLIQYF